MNLDAPHTDYVIAAYAIAFAILAGVVISVFRSYRKVILYHNNMDKMTRLATASPPPMRREACVASERPLRIKTKNETKI